MKLGARIFICYIVIFAVCFYYPVDWMLTNLRTRYLEGVEDPLVDQANILAALVETEFEKDAFRPERLANVFQRVYQRRLDTRIYDLDKAGVDQWIYITDRNGRVIFDSQDQDNVGEDYSNWRDVRLTLEGRYGARTTRSDPEDLTSSVLYVAAPIRVDGEIAGVLTVAKPTVNINSFLKTAKPRIVTVGSLAAAAAVVFSLVASFWITRPIRRLTAYANTIRAGHRVELPPLDRSEIGTMGQAFENMRVALEGREYIEQYVQTLTHELKSPLSAIRGAAELLGEKMEPRQRQRFLSNITNEAARIQDLVDRMLELAALESRSILPAVEPVSLNTLVKTVLESKGPLLSKRDLAVELKLGAETLVPGNAFLLHQAVSNLIQNAIDFSPAGGTVAVTMAVANAQAHLSILDEGPGIPDYAEHRIFEKFFSLQRPGTGKKSTGLGLNLVREVAKLHGGVLTLANRSAQTGVRARLSLEAISKNGF